MAIRDRDLWEMEERYRTFSGESRYESRYRTADRTTETEHRRYILFSRLEAELGRMLPLNWSVTLARPEEKQLVILLRSPAVHRYTMGVDLTMRPDWVLDQAIAWVTEVVQRERQVVAHEQRVERAIAQITPAPESEPEPPVKRSVKTRIIEVE